MPSILLLTLAIVLLALLLGATAYESVVMAPNYERDVPRSIDAARAFLQSRTPAHYFRPLAPLAQLLLLGAVATCWRVPGARWPALTALGAMLLADVITFTFHYPRLAVMFKRDAPVAPEALARAAREWSRGNLVRLGLIVVALLGALVAFGAVHAGPAPARAHEAALLRLEASGMQFAHSADVPAGLVRIRLVNRDPVWHEASVFRFRDSSGTLAAYLAAANAGDEYPAFAEDAGGVSLLAPGDSAEVLVRLLPGRYGVVCWHQDHLKGGMGATFTVTGPAPPAAPPADSVIEVTLDDYSVILPEGMAPAALLHIRNLGPSEHELAILRLQPDRSYEDFMAWRAGGEAGPAPVRAFGGTAALLPGGEAWAPAPPGGDYVFVCLLEDPTGRLHTELGMRREVTLP